MQQQKVSLESKEEAGENKEAYDDAQDLSPLLERYSGVESVEWIFDVLTNKKQHPRIVIAFADKSPFVFVTYFDAEKKKIIFQIDRTFIRVRNQDATSTAKRDVARLLFVREATLAMLLEPGKNYDTYMSCASAVPPTEDCFRLLLATHLAALQEEWSYAESRNLTHVFPESIVRDRDAFVRLGISPEDAEFRALAIYGIQGHISNLFWTNRYREFLDDMFARSALPQR
ncbi:MAG: hypothetical protein Q7S09_02210 [bacterium]|nr:hypothetical protein [bacterium]